MKIKTTKNEWLAEVNSYLNDFDNAENEYWFEWIQDANELLVQAIKIIKQK